MIRKEINKISEVGKALISVEGNPGVALNHVVELLEAGTNQSLSFAKAINITEDSTRFQVFNGWPSLTRVISPKSGRRTCRVTPLLDGISSPIIALCSLPCAVKRKPFDLPGSSCPIKQCPAAKAS